MIAIGFAAIFGPWPWKKERPARGAPPDNRTERLINEFSGKLGIETPEVVVDKESDGLGDGLVFCDQVLYLYVRQWKEFSFEEQDFLLARKLAIKAVKGMKRPWPLQVSLFVAGAAIACYNMWLILPLHSVGLTTMLWEGMLKHRRQTLELDVLAVRATGDLGAAKRYIRSHTKGHEVVSPERRLANLEAVFG